MKVKEGPLELGRGKLMVTCLVGEGVGRGERGWHGSAPKRRASSTHLLYIHFYIGKIANISILSLIIAKLLCFVGKFF